MSTHTDGIRRWVVLSIVGLVAIACGDSSSPVGPSDPSGGEPAPAGGDPGLAVRLVPDSPTATVGDTVTLRARIQAGGEAAAMTPSGFQAKLTFPESGLTPVSAVEPDDAADDVLRIVNLEAGPGVIKAAGSTARGFRSSTLFAVRMRVESSAWARGLGLELGSLSVLENDFAEVSSRVDVSASPTAGTGTPSSLPDGGDARSEGGGGQR